MIRLLQFVVFLVCCSRYVNSAFNVEHDNARVSVSIGATKLLEHTRDSPFLFVGNAASEIEEHLGNFQIDQYVQQRIALTDFTVDGSPSSGYVVTFSRGGDYVTKVKFGSDGKQENVVSFTKTPSNVNRYWIRLFAEVDEHVYGGGEQFSYFDLRGHNFPMWTREQGVGRNKSTIVTFYSNQYDNGGGDYHTTYYPEPTFVSSRKYYCHFDTTVYSVLDFRHSNFHEVEIWSGQPGKLYFDTASTMLGLVQQLSAFLGRQPELPEWLHNGAVLGIQGGTEAMLGYIKQAKEHGVRVSGVWIQDWSGRIKTSFGSRIFWNWKWNPEHYPKLDVEIKKLKNEGISVLTYISPYLNKEGDLFKVADAKGYFVKTPEGKTHIANFGEFYVGSIDLTNPKACEWYKNDIIKKEMIEFGLSGWMADFSEYLPTENVVFHSGESAEVLHNKWPILWATLNRQAVEESGKLGEILFWMRAGYSGSQKQSTIMWAGDQFVDYSRGDGLPSVIPAALSLGMIGSGVTHFDIGGYTALFDYARSEELLLRSGEMAVFTPMMRTHEGNRPKVNWQYYSSEGTLRKFARLTQLHHALTDYTKATIKENTEQGIPTVRPLFLHYENDPETYNIAYQYLYGRDLLVAPVCEPNRDSWDLYLPDDKWVYLWNDTQLVGGQRVVVDAPLGYPPVFYRHGSVWTKTFQSLTKVMAPKDDSSSTYASWQIWAAVILAATVAYILLTR